MVFQDLLIQLSVSAAPAILTNACATMQSSATARYQLAIPQWREFRASHSAHDEQLAELYASPESALNLAERRIRLLLRGLNLLYVGVALFGATTFMGLFTAFISPDFWAAIPLVIVMLGMGTLGLVVMLTATAHFVVENRCASGLLELQLRLDRVRDLHNTPHPVPTWD